MKVSLAKTFLLGFLWATAASADPMEDGRERSTQFLAGQIDEIWSAMTPQMQGALGSSAALEQLRAGLERDLGAEAEVLDETILQRDGHQVYLRTSRWTKSKTPLVMQWTLDSEAKIAGFYLRPAPVAAESRFLDYQTKAELRFPFEGEWFVYWGGRTIEQNYHAADAGQRFAVDLVVRKDGATHAGDPMKLENYHCWDKPVLVPADGTVVKAVSDLPDNAIGQTDAAHPAGNHVVIDFGNGEFGFLAHFRQGSVKAKVGDRMTTGQELGRCGNSGNTSEPHLHVHLQTTATLSAGEGLPAYFNGFVADGKPVERGELVKGQTVSPE